MMGISLNKVGNYSANIRPRTASPEKFNLDQNQGLKAKAASGEQNSITPEEKNYFIKLYPESIKEITDYHFYQKSGQMSGIKIGSNIDRRG